MASIPTFTMLLVLMFSVAVNLFTLPKFYKVEDFNTILRPFCRCPPVAGAAVGRGEEEGRTNVCSEQMGEAAPLDSPPLPLLNNGCHSPAAAPRLSPDSVINLDHGDPTMFEAYWKTTGDQGTLVIPGWQTMSYFSDIGNACWFLEPEFAEEVRRLHQQVGNAITDDKHVVVGTGSTQLFQAALYALAPADVPQPTNVVSAIPYYSSYPVVTDYLQSRLYKWAGDANAYNGEAPYIELVCSPNNPDGFSKQAVLSSENGKTIHDLAYYWPQYTAITNAPDHDIMLFTVSKSTGHAGTRIGWALVKDKEVAQKMTRFIELNTIGVSKDSQLRAARMLRVVTNSHEDHRSLDRLEPFFQYGRRVMTARWERLRAAVKGTGAFSLPDFHADYCMFNKELTEPHPAFAWMKCEKEGIDDCRGFLKSHKILTRSGKHFGVDEKYVRVSMLDRDPSFDLFIERLLSIR